MDQIIQWQESVLQEFKYQIQFDVTGVLDMYPKGIAALTPAEYLEALPKFYRSEAYNFKAGVLNTNWKVRLDTHGGDETGKGVAIGIFLELVSCKPDESNEGVKINGSDSGPSNSTEDCVRASYALNIVNSTGDILLERDSAPLFFPKKSLVWGFSKLITLDDLSSKYGVDGTLRLRLHLKIFGDTSFRHNKTLPSSSSSLCADFAKLLASGVGSDVSVNCSGQVFKLHKAILAARSNVFGKMFQSNMAESISGNVFIQDIQANIFQMFLEFLYSSKLNLETLTYDELIELVRAGDKYELEDLKEICFQTLVGMMTEDNCGELAVLGYLHSAKIEYRNHIFQFCSKNWPKLVLNANFRKFAESHFGAFSPPVDASTK